MKVTVATHVPVSYGAPYIRVYETNVEATDKVSDFKRNWSEVRGISPDVAEVFYGGGLRVDDMTLADGELKPNAPGDLCVINVRVFDPAVRAEVARRMAAGESLEIPLKNIVIREHVKPTKGKAQAQSSSLGPSIGVIVRL